MSFIDDIPPAPAYDPERDRAQRARLGAVWQPPRGWRYFAAVNNEFVGRWYILTAFAFFTFTGILALLMRAQLAVPDNDLLSATFYNQAFTMHGTVMMFLFAVPIFEAVAILVLPELLGARDLPFPRLSAFGYWCFVIGGVFVAGSIFFDAAPRAGWFMYPPLSSEENQTGIGTDIWLLGLSFIEVASIAAAIELIIGVLKARPVGMRLNLMPLYCWYVLVVGGMVLFAFPPLIAGDLLLEMERAFDWAFFDADRGGDPLLWQHLFWIFGHPEVYIIFLPSIALIAMIVPTFARVPMVGHSWIVLSAVGIAFLSFGLWVHHMFATGLPEISLSFFSAASEAVAVPTGVQIFCFIATLLVGRASLSGPMLFAGGALAIFVLGGLTGVMGAAVPFDLQAHDSYFVVAHPHDPCRQWRAVHRSSLRPLRRPAHLRSGVQREQHRASQDKATHPRTNGQVERMNRTIEEATFRRYHHADHDQLRTHLADFIAAYNCARRLKTLVDHCPRTNGAQWSTLTPCEHIAKCWTEEPDRFRFNPNHHMPGPNT